MSPIKISRFLSGEMKVVGTVHSEDSLYCGLKLFVGAIDYLELRVDHFAANLTPLREAISILPASFIVTVRHPDEGGANHLEWERRRQLFEEFMPNAAFIDVELRSVKKLAAVIAQAREHDAGVIVSDHYFDGTPQFRTLAARLRQAEDAGADVFKIAALTDNATDLGVLLKLAETPSDVALSLMGMGRFGKVSRLLLAQAGSVLNYGYLDKPNASGQWEATVLKKRLKELLEDRPHK